MKSWAVAIFGEAQAVFRQMRNRISLVLFRALLLLVLTISGRAATVTSLGDSGLGSLRQAILDAAAGATIDFSVTGAITLTSGELGINKSLTILGPGADK